MTTPGTSVIRILLADDHALVRRGVRLILDREPDLEVVAEAGDGAEAVELARTHEVDLAVMDIAMPRMTGLQATRELVALKPGVRVLMLTMHEDVAYLREAFARKAHVGHRVYDHSSILKMVEWRFGLAPLTKRDRAARNLAESLDFSHQRPAPDLPLVPDPGPHLCQPPIGTNPMGLEDPFWRELAESPLMRGWRSLV